MVAFYPNFMSRLVGRSRSASRARSLIKFSNSFIVDHFNRFGYAVEYDQLAFTLERVADFMDARDTLWHRPGTIAILDSPGLLIVEEAQPRARQPTRDVVVVSLGDARVGMGVINRKGRPRFAETM